MGVRSPHFAHRTQATRSIRCDEGRPKTPWLAMMVTVSTPFCSTTLDLPPWAITTSVTWPRPALPPGSAAMSTSASLATRAASAK